MATFSFIDDKLKIEKFHSFREVGALGYHTFAGYTETVTLDLQETRELKTYLGRLDKVIETKTKEWKDARRKQLELQLTKIEDELRCLNTTT